MNNAHLPTDNLNCIAIDESNVIWLGGYYGLVRFDGTEFQYYNKGNSNLPSNNITCITIDNNGTKWLGTYDAGLVEFDDIYNLILYNTSNSYLPSNSISDIAIDSDGNKWIGTRVGLVKIDASYNLVLYLSGIWINCIEIDGSNNIWIGIKWSGLVKLDAVDETLTYYEPHPYSIQCLAIDKYDNKWIGTGTEGLAKLDADDTTWNYYDSSKIGFFADLGYADNGFLCMAIDNSDNKWLGLGWDGYGSYGAGLGKLDADDTTWTIRDTSNSLLPSDWINCIAIDEYGNKWIGTREGLAVFNEGGIITDLDSQEQIDEIIPNEYLLSQNYPNPFNPSTTIKYEIPDPSRADKQVWNDNVNVTLKVYDILGIEVATLVNQQQKPGYYEVNWDASNNSSGVYFYRIRAGDPAKGAGQGFVETKKMILLR